MPARAHLGEPLREPVRQPDRQRHQVGRLVAGVAEHHPLVAGALGAQLVLAARAAAQLEGGRHALVDVGRLLVDRDDDAAGLAVEAVLLAVVADLADRLADDARDVDVAGRRDLAGDDDEPGREQRLAGDPAVGVRVEDRVEDGVGDLVGHLVGMTLGHRLRGEDVAVCHRCTPSGSGRRRVRRYDRLPAVASRRPARLAYGGRAVRPRGCRRSATSSSTASATRSLLVGPTSTASPSAARIVTALVSCAKPTPAAR